VRVAILAILKQLNQAETVHEGRSAEQAVEFDELERRLNGSISPTNGSAVPNNGRAKLALALGLLVRNGLCRAEADPDYSWQRQRPACRRFRITAEGKRFLVQAIDTADRIG
jgi:hypothetical protein